jgi:hypothetical protein
MNWPFKNKNHIKNKISNKKQEQHHRVVGVVVAAVKATIVRVPRVVVVEEVVAVAIDRRWHEEGVAVHVIMGHRRMHHAST